MSRSDRQTAATPAPSFYVNYFEVAQNPLEFLLELGQYRPARGDTRATVTMHTYTAMAPSYAKLLSELLARAVSEHEEEYGPVAGIPEAGSGEAKRKSSNSKSQFPEEPGPSSAGSKRRAKAERPP